MSISTESGRGKTSPIPHLFAIRECTFVYMLESNAKIPLTSFAINFAAPLYTTCIFIMQTLKILNMEVTPINILYLSISRFLEDIQSMLLQSCLEVTSIKIIPSKISFC